MFTNSIRWRLQLWLAFLLVCVLSGFGIAVYQLQRVNQFQQIDDELNRRVAALSRSVRTPPDFGPGRPRGEGGREPGGPRRPDFDDPPSRPDFEEGPRRPFPMRGRPESWPPDGPRGGPPGMHRPGPRELRLLPETAALFDQSSTNDFYFSVWGRNATVLKISTNAPAEIPFPDFPKDTLTHTRNRADVREAYHFTELGDCVLAGRSIKADLKALNRFKLLALAVGGAVLAFGLGGGWWLTNRAIKPVEEISAAASRISAGNLAERISGAEADNELGRLAGVLNSTFARLEAAFVQQKQFTADASHELRTPLAVIISETQTALARERTAAEYRETVEACLDTAQQMRRITQSLLALARFDADQEHLLHERVDLAELARAEIERIRLLAKQGGIEIHSSLATAETCGDADHLGQILTNLLTNAINYNKPNGQIRVDTQTEGEFAILTVTDTGVGIAADDIPHIFERFYRADKSRGRSAGHTGLGLAICKAITEAHRGTIEVTSQVGVGTTFTVRVPSWHPEENPGRVLTGNPKS